MLLWYNNKQSLLSKQNETFPSIWTIMQKETSVVTCVQYFPTPKQTKPNPNSRIFFGLLFLSCFVWLVFFPKRFVMVSDKHFELKDEIIPLLNKTVLLNLTGLTSGQTQLFGMVSGSSNIQKAAFTLNLYYQGQFHFKLAGNQLK